NISISPESASTNRLICLINVVLPQPLVPTIVTNSPSSIVKLISFNAGRVAFGNVFGTFLNSIAVVMFISFIYPMNQRTLERHLHTLHVQYLRVHLIL